jgi:hypothetical protein
MTSSVTESFEKPSRVACTVKTNLRSLFQDCRPHSNKNKMSDAFMTLTVVAHVPKVKEGEEQIFLSCFNREVERSVPATQFDIRNGTNDFTHTHYFVYFMVRIRGRGSPYSSLLFVSFCLIVQVAVVFF